MQTTWLELEAFTSLDNTIPQATVSDYVAHIAEWFESPAESRPVERSLSRVGDDGSQTLCVASDLQAGSFTTKITFSIVMFPIPLQAADMLEARLRDVEQSRAVLQAENDTLRALVTDHEETYKDSLVEINLKLEEIITKFGKRPAFIQATPSPRMGSRPLR